MINFKYCSPRSCKFCISDGRQVYTDLCGKEKRYFRCLETIIRNGKGYNIKICDDPNLGEELER